MGKERINVSEDVLMLLPVSASLRGLGGSRAFLLYRLPAQIFGKN
jgi:hypothetical protein